MNRPTHDNPAIARSGQRAFTLVELLTVIGIIALLVSILMPSLSSAREIARSGKCIGTLNALGKAMGSYTADNKESYWPCTIVNHPQTGVNTYFWGTNTDPVDTHPSPFMAYCDYNLAYLWCPSQRWGTYVPQGGVGEPTTTYGYNAWCLDPPAWGRRDSNNRRMLTKHTIQIPKTSDLFVFADSGMAWSPGGVLIFQNSTHLEPVTGPWQQQPTTHFRHNGRANALCADGHAGGFTRDGGAMPDPKTKLGFVGTSNVPHYDIEED